MKSTKERHDLLVAIREMMSSLGPEKKKQLCFEYTVDQGKMLNYSEIYVLGMALDSLKGRSCVAILALLTLTSMNKNKKYKSSASLYRVPLLSFAEASSSQSCLVRVCFRCNA